MKISVWLYLDLRDISHVSMEMEVNHTTEGAESQTQEVIAAGEDGCMTLGSALKGQGGRGCSLRLTDCFPVFVPEWLGAELRIVGKVEISGEASLDDLKSQVEKESISFLLNVFLKALSSLNFTASSVLFVKCVCVC